MQRPSGGVGAGIVGAIQPDEPCHVIVGVDVPDRAGNVRRLVAIPRGLEDGCLQPRRGLLVAVGRSPQRLPRLVVHAGQCRTLVKTYGHEPILRYGCRI